MKTKYRCFRKKRPTNRYLCPAKTEFERSIRSNRNFSLRCDFRQWPSVTITEPSRLEYTRSTCKMRLQVNSLDIYIYSHFPYVTNSFSLFPPSSAVGSWGRPRLRSPLSIRPSPHLISRTSTSLLEHIASVRTRRDKLFVDLIRIDRLLACQVMWITTAMRGKMSLKTCKHYIHIYVVKYILQHHFAMQDRKRILGAISSVMLCQILPWCKGSK